VTWKSGAFRAALRVGYIAGFSPGSRLSLFAEEGIHGG
jgi:hypothetical protein